MSRDKNTHKTNWIRQLLAVGLTYDIVTLHEQPLPEQLGEAEMFWIVEMRKRGHRLTNITPGGDGWQLGQRHSPETRAKISAANKGRTCSPDHCRKNGDAHRGQDMSRAVQASAEATRGKKRPPRSQEWKERIGAARRGKPLSSDHKDKLRLAGTGQIRRSYDRVDPHSGEAVEYAGLRAAEQAGFNMAAICNVCAGKADMHRGFWWLRN